MRQPIAAVLSSEQREVYAAIQAVAAERGAEVYLVGGAVRDWLMDRPVGDLDFTIAGDAVEFALALQQVHGGEVLAHERFRTATWSGHGLQTDITSARSETYPRPAALPVVTPASIEQDLPRRDFTINAMALRLRDLALLDPLGGQADLQRKLMRALHSRSFVDDPTRMLRAARYAAQLGFRIEPQTRRWIDAGLPYIKDLSGERIKYDLELILDIAAPEDALLLLHEWSFFKAIGIAVPEPEPLRARFMAVRSRLSEWDCTGLGLSTQEIIRTAGWGALMYNLGQMSAARWIESIPYTTEVRDALVSLGVLSTLAAGLFAGKPSRRSQLLRSFSGLALLIGWLFDRSAAKQASMYAEWHNWRRLQLYTGGDDLRALGLPPGPRYRALLDRLRDARLDGEVHSAQEERDLLDRLLREPP
ncbi:MAG: hypothetical protein M1434_09245 [Chloroflexi bacterium]|nr:hypothetical protein [Chloroflexota bacterium]MCL5274910.1 hypothetical protein [Chloroflexota bacterium]